MWVSEQVERPAIALAALLLLATPGRAGEPGLVFSARTWEGEYASKDVPGGVESTPTVGAVYTINADGTGLRRVVPPGAGVDYPVASRDGKWVYYQAGERAKSQIYRCRFDGTGVTSLTPPDELTKRLKGDDRFRVKEAFGYALSADGTRMVFTVHDGSAGRVVVADADGSNPAFVAPGLGYTYMARLGPKNDRVAFSGPTRGYRLQLAELPDGKPVELTPDHPECFVPQFTPDGKAVVFVRRDGDVYRVDADGKNLKRLTEGNKYVEFRLSPKDAHGSTDGPDVSPDGKQVAFIAVKDGVPNVFVVAIDGSNRRQLTAREVPCGRVKWSPDGKLLSFVSFEGKYPQLFVVPAAGGDGQPLARPMAWRNLAMMVGHWALRGYGLWAVEERATGVFVGRIGFWNPEGWPGFELGWTLRRVVWGKGYATEGARATLRFAFTQLKQPHVISLIHPENAASIRVAERLGEQRVDSTEVFGKPAVVYRITREEWEGGMES